MNIGMAGEVTFNIISNNSGNVVSTNKSRNIILNKGLDAIADTTTVSDSIFTYCIIGSGTSIPIATQNQLDVAVAIVRTDSSTSSFDYTDTGDGLYKVSCTHKYVFTGLNNVNITEVGLVNTSTSISNYNLCTRSLIKDALGNPTAISIKNGETLEVFYTLWQVFSTADIVSQSNMLDGDGNGVPYNVITRLARVGTNEYDRVGSKLNLNLERNSLFADGLSAITSAPNVPVDTKFNANLKPTSVFKFPYVTGSYEQKFQIAFTDLTEGNGTLRTLMVFSSLGVYQIRFGSVSGDLGVIKTNKDTLYFRVNLTWSRYEGEL